MKIAIVPKKIAVVSYPGLVIRSFLAGLISGAAVSVFIHAAEKLAETGLQIYSAVREEPIWLLANIFRRARGTDMVAVGVADGGGVGTVVVSVVKVGSGRGGVGDPERRRGYSRHAPTEQAQGSGGNRAGRVDNLVRRAQPGVGRTQRGDRPIGRGLTTGTILSWRWAVPAQGLRRRFTRR